MKSICLYIAIAILLISEGFILYVNKNLRAEIALKNQIIANIGDRYDAEEMQISMGIDNDGKYINGKTLAKDTSGASIDLYHTMNQGTTNTLVFRYTDRMCNECVEHAVSIFTDNKKSFGTKKIIFLDDNINRNVLKQRISEYGLQDCRVLNCPNLGIPAEEAMFPYIMAVDSSLRVLSVYFPNKSTHGTDYDYKHVKYMYDKLIKPKIRKNKFYQ